MLKTLSKVSECQLRKGGPGIRQDTAEKKERIRELQRERTEIKSWLKEKKAQLRRLERERREISLGEPGDVIQDRMGALENEIQKLEEKLLTLKEGILAVWHGDGFALILQEVYCGKNCRGCPHGPYWRVTWREGTKTIVKHLGPSTGPKALSIERAKEWAYALRLAGRR
jgi:hypothetical protein